MISLQDRIAEVYALAGTSADLALYLAPPAVIVNAINQEARPRRPPPPPPRRRPPPPPPPPAPHKFQKNASMTLVRDAAADLPEDCERILDVQGSNRKSIPNIDYVAGGNAERAKYGYEVIGRQIWLRNISGGAYTLRYATAAWPDLHYGTLAGVSGTSPILPAASTVGPNPSRKDGLYAGMVLMLHSGTGSPDWRTITAYNGTTRVCTLASAFTVTPNSATTYSILPPFPEHLQDVLSLGAQSRLPVPEWRAMCDMQSLQMLRAGIMDWANEDAMAGSSLSKALSAAIADDM